MHNDALQKVLVAHFRHFHRHPEPSGAEWETTAHIRKILEDAGVEILDAGLETGLVARVRGGGSTKTIAFRADIDALRIAEESGLDCASENPGVMHACGHDFHTAALIGAALETAERREELAGDVKFIFQPSEETAGGALSVIKSGVLDDVGQIYGLHCAPDYPDGAVAVCPGETFAASIEFKITVKGRGGHAALPHKAQDPVAAAAALITLAQTIISRNADPFDPIVLGFSHIEAGTTWNVIPDDALLEGTIRALAEKKATDAAERLGEICTGIEAAHGVRAVLDWWIDAPPTNNDAVLTEFVAEQARKLGLPVVRYVPTMMGEDFGYYQKSIRGVFFNFGVGCPYGLHTPHFVAHTGHLADAAKLFAEIAVESLKTRW
jgi:amidohydrolase